MASNEGFMVFIVEQIESAGAISYRKMFGEYAVYCDGKVVALVCDNRLFVKPTAAGRVFIGEVVEAPPYSRAKPYFLIEEQLEDREWLSELIRITAAGLPQSIPGKKKKSPAAGRVKAQRNPFPG